MTTKTQIIEAIKNRKLLMLYYKLLFRIVEPYFLGVGDDHHDVLYCYQTAGESLSGEPGWREFKLDEIRNLVPTEISFKKIREDYKFGIEEMKFIYWEIEEDCLYVSEFSSN